MAAVPAKSPKRNTRPATARGRRGSPAPRAPSSDAAPGTGAPKKPVTDAQRAKVARTLKAVANPVRLKMLEALEAGELTVGAIRDAVGAKPAIVSQHLGLMRDRGVLAARREGSHVFYRIANPHVLKVIDCIRRSCATYRESED